MSPAPVPALRQKARDLFVFTQPRRWAYWPFLPLVRRHPDDTTDYGVLCDLRGLSGRTGYSSTVFLGNLFALPRTEAGLLALRQEVFDTPEEMADAGWTAD
jgi:hypothetical protein